MDLIKIGNFITEKRKAKNLTQLQLAERLCVTDRAVSKWECGRSLPDSSIMLELCKVLDITVNELLTGEELEMENYSKQAEINLLNAVKQKEQADKRLLNIEIMISFLGIGGGLTLSVLGIFGYQNWDLPLWAMIVVVSLAVVMIIVTGSIALKIEQKAGYYECQSCHHRYVPTYLQVIFAPHINRSRFMKCPHCGKRTYNKKVLSEKQ